MFSNDCSDGSNLLLNRLDQMGVIKHFDNPPGPRMDPQRAAYSWANRMEFVRSADWVLIVDADEFLNVKTGDHSIDHLITECGGKDADAISVNWRLMGSCGQAHMSDDLVTTRFTRGSDFDDPENGLVWGARPSSAPANSTSLACTAPSF
nr:glycosyltransferase family 2 protein [Thalassobium sp. R2A62]